MKRETIAMVAHEVNRAYCASLGDISQPAWADAPEWQQQSALAGVDMHLANPDATPEQSHASWLEAKLADGWVYGEVKDADAKVHPCCVPYDQLPVEQKAKDYLFRGVVHALRDIEPEVVTVAAPAAAVVTQQALAPVISLAPGEIGVKYIGRRETFEDRNFGTGLIFAQGQVRSLPALLARKFLRHADQFEEAEIAAQAAVADAGNDDGTADALKKASELQQDQHKELNALQDLRDQVQHMTKKGLEEFAMTKYSQKLNMASKVDDLRIEVISFIDRFGAV